MRTAVSRKDGQIAVEDVTLIDPGDGQVVVRLEASAICITDTVSVDGFSPSTRPFVPGHSATGIVEEVGAGVSKAKVGERIILAGTMECGVCYQCQRGAPSQCDKLWETVFSAPQVIGHADSDGTAIVADGGAGAFAERMVYHERCFGVVESDLPAEQLALLGCGGISGIGAVVEIARVQPGDSVAVLGCGHLGLWMIQAARASGAERIFAIEPLAHRRALAGDLGATDLIDPADGDPEEHVRSLTSGRGADVALEATGSSSGMEQVFGLARQGGIVVPTSVAVPLMTSTVTLPAAPFALFGKQIRSSQSGGGFLRRDIPRFARMIESGRIDAAAMVSRRFALDEVSEAFDAARRREVITGVLLNQS
jgi:Zn-dependent alcohol dehydrogenase